MTAEEWLTLVQSDVRRQAEDEARLMALARSNKEQVLVDHAFRCGVREGESYGE